MTVGEAFYLFRDKLFVKLKKIELSRLQRRCLDIIDLTAGASLSDLKMSIQAKNNPDDLFSLLCSDVGYICNWINIRILEKMSVGCDPAEGMIKQYKKEIHSRNLVECNIPHLNIPADKHGCFTKIEETWNRDITSMAIKDFVKHWDEIEKLLNVKESLLLHKVTCGCKPVKIVWLLCNDFVEHANDITTVNNDNHLLAEVSYLKIGDNLVKDGKL